MKTVCYVQARMDSQRLPGKTMKDVTDGHPLIEYVLRRASLSRYIDNVVLVTSVLPANDVLAEFANRIGYDVFRGDERNVLERFKQANDHYKGDLVMRLTGDCPLTEGVLLDGLIARFLSHKYDFIRVNVPDGFIRGFDAEIFTRATLDKTYDIVTSGKLDESPQDIEAYKEHVTLYMYRHPEIFSYLEDDGTIFYNKDYRLCVDTAEDFLLIKKIFTHFDNMYVPAKDVVEYLDNNPELVRINAMVEQKK